MPKTPLEKIETLAEYALKSYFSSNEQKRKFSQDATRLNAREAYRVMWGDSREAGFEHFHDSYMEHLWEFYPETEGVERSGRGFATKSTKGTPMSLVEIARFNPALDAVATFYNISAMNLVTTGGLLKEEISGIKSEILESRVSRILERFESQINSVIKKLYFKINSVLNMEQITVTTMNGIRVCNLNINKTKNLSPIQMLRMPLTTNTCTLVLHKFMKPWETCNIENHKKIGEKCYDCAIGFLEKNNISSKLGQQTDKGSIFGLGGSSQAVTTKLDATAKRDVGFNFYWFEPPGRDEHHISRYGPIHLSSNLSTIDKLEVSLVQTLDLVTPELHALRESKPQNGKDNTSVRKDSIVNRNIRKVGKENQREYAHDRGGSNFPQKKKQGFQFKIGYEDYTLMPLELIFVWPHARIGMILRAWLTIFRLLKAGNGKAVEFIAEQPQKGFLTQFFRPQVLISGQTKWTDHTFDGSTHIEFDV